jgi:hypothetical protein
VTAELNEVSAQLNEVNAEITKCRGRNCAVGCFAAILFI